MEMKPSEIFYSQDSIMNKFGGYTSHGDTYIGETLDQLLSGHCNVNSIPTITVVNKNGKWFTSDNRRLWVFRKAEELGFLKTITVKVSHYLNEDKFTTVNNGTSIRVRGGGPGGISWKSWRPRRTHTPKNYNLNEKRVTSANRSTPSISSVYGETRNPLRQNANRVYASSPPLIPNTQHRTSISPDYTTARSYGLSYASDYRRSQPKDEDAYIRSISSNTESVSRSTLSPSFSQPYQGNFHTKEHSPPNYRQLEESYHSRNRDFIHSNYSPRDPASAVTRPPTSSTETRSEMYQTEPSNREINHKQGCCTIL